MTIVTFAGYSFFMSRRKTYHDRLEAMELEEKAYQTDDDRLVLGPLTEALAGQSPLTEGKRKVVEQELREAGFYRPTALMEYSPSGRC